MAYASKEQKKAYMRQYYQANKGQIKQYCQVHKEAKAEYDKQYYKEKKESKNAQHKQYYRANKDRILQYQRQLDYITHGKGYQPINSYKRGYSAHHLFLESNNAFCVYIPEFVHSFYQHNSKTEKGMQTINAVALSIFIDGDEQFL